jgi:DNA polymerase III subunit beta
MGGSGNVLDELIAEDDATTAAFKASASAVTSARPTDTAQLGFTTKKFVLLTLLDRASSVVPSRDVMPLLKNFQITVETPGRLTVVATDMELSVVTTTEMVTVETPGVAIFPAKKFLDILNQGEDTDVQVSVSAGTARVVIGRTSWSLRLLPGADYPDMPDVGSIEFTSVDREKFLVGLQSVRYAAAREVNRHSLMMIDVTEGLFTACDGTRIQQAPLGAELDLSLQIPVGAIDNLVKLLKASELDKIEIGLSDTRLVFRIGTDLFLINKLMAQFPDVEELLLRPALSNKDRLTVDRAELETAVRRVRITADPETSAIGLVLTPNRLVVTSRDKLDNGAEEALSVEWLGSNRTVVVNHKFLLELLAMYGGMSCAFYLGPDSRSRKSPLLLKDDSGSIGLIQQMLGFLSYED